MGDSRRKPVGGVESVGLSVATDWVAAPDSFSPIKMVENRTTYTEVINLRSGIKSISHTLRIVTEPEAQLFKSGDQYRAESFGVVAKITLNNGMIFTVGSSPRFNIEQPLRLKSVTLESGAKPLDRPVKVWLWECEDMDCYIENK